jgi:hypothetical protein
MTGLTDAGNVSGRAALIHVLTFVFIIITVCQGKSSEFW